MAGAAFVTDLTEIITQAAEAAAGISSIVAAGKVLDLAEDYYDLYRQQREFYYNTFQQGLEAPLAAEVYRIAPYELNYGMRVATAYDPATGPFGGASTDALGWWTRHAAAYNTAIDPDLRHNLDADMARIKVDWANYLERFEEQYADESNDRRWAKRYMLHNIGVKEGTAASAALDRAVDQHTDQVQAFGDQMATYGNGIARYVGYKRGLSDTADDFAAMAYERRTIPVPDYNEVRIGQLA